jgi:hypothetical protein
MSPSRLPESLRDGPFSTAGALARGVGPGRLRGRDLASPFHGVRVPATNALDDARERVLALAPVLRPGWCFSHVTALLLWGLPLSLSASGRQAPIHVGVPGGRGPRRPGVVGHDLAGDISHFEVAGLPVVDPVSAWCQSAALLSLDALVAVGDALAGSWSPHPAARGRPMAELATGVEARAGTRRAGRLREALCLVRPRVESPKETELRLLLVRAGLPEPEVNVKQRDAAGRYLGKPDLSWAGHLVSAEYEGDEHRSDPHRWRNDIDRAERFTDAGWRMIRVTQRDLHGAGAERLILRLSRLLVL